MRAINVLLSILVSLLILAALMEGGLRLIGKGPAPSPLQPHPELGWAKKPNFSMSKSAKEFRASFELNAEGLRDDPLGPKAPDEFRVIALGDSFTYGFTVDRDQLFVDLLEQYWRSEGRNVQVINAGTEAWDTAQAVRWLELEGKKYEPDLVLLFPYENDLYWNSRTAYLTADGPADKPRYAEDGSLEARSLAQFPKKPWTAGFAITKWMARPQRRVGYPVPGATFPIDPELLPLLHDTPQEVEAAVEAHTLGALRALKRAASALGAEVAVAPIPSAVAYSDSWRKKYSTGPRARLPGLSTEAWSPDKPVETFLRLAQAEGLPTVDARGALRKATDAGDALYYREDWHFNENGNRVFAKHLHDSLEGVVALPAKRAEGALPPAHGEAGGVPFAAKLYLGLLAGLTGLYWITYPKENRLLAPLKIGLLLGAVFGIFLGILYLRELLPPAVSRWLVPGFVALILGFVAFKLGRKVTTITELLSAFIRRGHWYLMPLVVVLVTIGSLLVVAASSPFVAPFIYTLF
ncbi:MAG: hypothetical protein GC161_01205 [Planctomycetaceae bacterium]|nr:hypothetical protein [Planctomycetaceae bacterium]